MLYLSARFSNKKEAQAALAQSGFFLLDIHQVLFHRRGVMPLIRALFRVKRKRHTFKEGITALCSRTTWKTWLTRYREGNRVTEAYLDAAQRHSHLHSELLNYSNNIYTADTRMYDLLASLRQTGHELYLLSNIGNATLERLRSEYPNYFGLMSDPHNTINRQAAQGTPLLWKPQPTAYVQSLAVIGKATTPHHAIFIDDTKRNVAAAHAVGMNAILFRSFAQCKRDIETLLGRSHSSSFS